MTMCRIGIVGYFAQGKSKAGGQEAKTYAITSALRKKYGDDNVKVVDTTDWKRHPYRLFSMFNKVCKVSDIIIMLPAHNGLKVFTPIMLHYKKKYEKKLFYDVIGGWLPEYLNEHHRIAKMLKKYDGIWVETSTMKQKLEQMGFDDNITVIPNFKDIVPLDEKNILYNTVLPYKICTFSRITKEKGIETAINAITAVNNKLGYVAYSLDIYGKIEPNQNEWFDSLKNKFAPYVKYCGCVKPEKSIEVLKTYFALLFPTHFYTEGVPGSIIDAYAAGVPVISSKWASFTDVIEEGVTGFGYDFNDSDMLLEILYSVAKHPEKIIDIKKNCLEKVKQFSSENAVEMIVKQLNS